MKKNARVFFFFYFLFWIVYFAAFWSRAIFFDPAGNLIAGHTNIWGDWAAHFTMTTAILQRGIFISSPFLIGAKFSYPFFADLVSAVLLKLNVPFLLAFLLPSFAFSVLLIFALFLFYKIVFHSKKVAILASLIFLLNGGVGFWYFFQDVAHAPQPLVALVTPLHPYTHIDTQQIEWMSVIDSMIIPQRAFLMGFPIAVLGLAGVWWLREELEKSEALEKKGPTKEIAKKRRKFQKNSWLIGCGILFGVLPIIHTHSFLAVFIILSCWAIFDLWKCWQNTKFWQHFLFWSILAVSTIVTSAPILWLFFAGHVNGNFLLWYPGWLAKEYQINWLLFWWKNWGPTLLGTALGLIVIFRKMSKKNWQYVLAQTVPFILIFALVNLFLFQPYSWDNTKLLAWCSLGFSAIAAEGILFLWKTARTKKQRALNLACKTLAIIFFLAMTLSGAIDAYWISRIDLHNFEMYSSSELSLANWAENSTPINSIWLTSDQHNHWLYNLTGRQPLMAYRGWLWSQGYAYHEVENNVSRMFVGAPETLDLLKKYHVQYVVIGDSERRDFFANDEFFAAHFKMVKSDGRTKIYQVF